MNRSSVSAVARAGIALAAVVVNVLLFRMARRAGALLDETGDAGSEVLPRRLLPT
ncbi:hypothetical protein [Amycolatopsis sp. Hca4]|uniref:hypothetical protein n=1 Tax=Amycolatopsis sp. Hca4 TaxID=2742131 RepID=UPI00159012C2|nr:hypothetical protein [Amycolatopsis sp. Hca4]QKV73209.1 hypothetical protein HUT10_04910 [Amycolatopsis sp. Hca4]